MTNVMLAEKWADEDPSGWWLSEKLDGVRAIWKGGQFLSRENNRFACPEWFAKQMPAGYVLDGELWGGRRQFQKTVGIVKSSSRGEEWKYITYMVFDILVEGGTSVETRPFEERLEAIKHIKIGANVLLAVPMQKCRGREHLQELLTEVESRGGEGLMMRRPKSLYEHRRSKSLLKVKTFHDEEAIIVGHETGKGRLSSMCGALLCETPDKRRFKVGSGLSDAQRGDPPKIGTVITYRYQELTNSNIPRFPTLAGERIDLNWRTICATYVPPGKKKEEALQKKHSVLFGDGCETASAPSASSAPAAAASAPPAPLRKRGLSAEDVAQRGIAVEDLEDLGGLHGVATEVLPPPAKRPRTSAADKLPMCPYGAKCYRHNPEHFTEFAHPWVDEENDDPMCITSSDVAGPASAVASHPICLKPGCGKPTYNGLSDEYCSKTHRAEAAVAGSRPASGVSATCLKPGCGKPTYNGLRGEYCGRAHRAEAAGVGSRPAYGAVASCMKPECGKPTWNGKIDEFCSRAHRREAGGVMSGTAPALLSATAPASSCSILLTGPQTSVALSSSVSAPSIPVGEPTPAAFVADPRHLQSGVHASPSGGSVGVIAFYFPDREESWDRMCKAGFLGNFWNVGLDQLKVEAPKQIGVAHLFGNAEAAFQALKFWTCADDFRHLSGHLAFQKKKKLSGQEDFTYGGHGNNWKGMLSVLKQKFTPGSMMAEKLKQTGDNLLLEHNSVPGRDTVWSDNSDGSGTNWLGLQLMLVRDQLTGQSSWTDFAVSQIDPDTGAPRGSRWPDAIRDATKALARALEYGHPLPRPCKTTDREIAFSMSSATAAPVLSAPELAPAAPAPVVSVPTPTASGDAGAEARDVRIIALKSLVSSLVKDAPSACDREHFQHLLDLLHAGPPEQAHEPRMAETAREPLPPFPPPDEPPPLAMLESMRPPAPLSPAAPLPAPSATAPASSSATAPASSSACLHHAETMVASAAEVAAVVSASGPSTASPPRSSGAEHSIEVISEIEEITSMGFCRADAMKALEHGRTLQAAIEWLLARK